MLNKFQHHRDIVKVLNFDYGISKLERVEWAAGRLRYHQLFMLDPSQKTKKPFSDRSLEV